MHKKDLQKALKTRQESLEYCKQALLLAEEGVKEVINSLDEIEADLALPEPEEGEDEL